MLASTKPCAVNEDDDDDHFIATTSSADNHDDNEKSGSRPHDEDNHHDVIDFIKDELDAPHELAHERDDDANDDDGYTDRRDRAVYTEDSHMRGKLQLHRRQRLRQQLRQQQGTKTTSSFV